MSISNSQQEQIHDLLSLSSLMSYHMNSDNILSSETRFVHSKFQRIFHFLLSDQSNQSIRQALGDQISNLDQVDNTLKDLNRNATLKFRNYQRIRQQVSLPFFCSTKFSNNF